MGLTMAKLLQDTCMRYSITLLDRGTAVADATSSSSSRLIPHPRSYALSPKSLNLIGTDVCSKLPLGEYDSMQIWEANSPAMLVFSNKHDLYEKEQQQQPNCLGACVEDSALVSALQGLLNRDSIRYQTTLKDISFHHHPHTNKIEVTTAPTTNPADDASSDQARRGSSTFTTDLVIAADGAQSPVRTKLGIGWKGLEYGRTAATFTVELSQSNNNKRAYQRFLPHGPIALLPTYSDSHAVVVWSTTPAEAALLKSMDSSSLTKLLNETLQQGPQRLKPLLERVGQTDPFSSLLYGMERVLDTVHYGMGMRHWSDDPETFAAPPMIASVPSESPRFTFPLSCKMASQFVHHHHPSSNHRVALIGDAAHTVHPMAGQGLNIGLEDVAALANAIQKAHDCGMEAGQFLDDYEQNRQWNVPLKVGGIHLLHSLFGMQSAPLMHGKSIGMSMINQFGPLRRQLAKIATGMD